MNQKHRLLIPILILLTGMLATACSVETQAAAVPTLRLEEPGEMMAAPDDEHSPTDEAQEDHGEMMAGTDDEHSHADEAQQEHDGMEHAHVKAPAEFTSLTNPLASDPDAVAAGKTLFATHCAPCHGESGRGDGAGGTELDPKPANLADGEMMAMVSDGYLFWRISKGGAMDPFNSAMPSWEGSLEEDQRWQLISYIRTLSGR